MNPGTAALTRGLDVLSVLGAEEATGNGGLGVIELTERIGADKSQLSRTLKTLEEHGFVERDGETLAYRLGWSVFSLAALVGRSRLLAEASPVMRGLVREFGESVHLSVRQGDVVVTLMTESPETTLHAPGRVGGTTPLTTTSAGRVLASEFESDELEQLGLAGSSGAIAEARERGFAIVREEFEPGLVAAAAPIRGVNGGVIAALNVSAPLFRFDDRLDQAALRLVEAANALSAAFGGGRAERSQNP